MRSGERQRGDFAETRPKPSAGNGPKASAIHVTAQPLNPKQAQSLQPTRPNVLRLLTLAELKVRRARVSEAVMRKK